MIRAGETSWSNAGVYVALAAGVALLLGFVVAETRVADPMFDLSLFRTPTFVGGLAAAFAMNGSLFSVLLYLVLYLQDLLGYSALGAGLRLLVLSVALLVAATAAGRLSEHVPVRLLIGPGLVIVGIGLLLMSGLTGTSTWTHLLPGLIVSGFGAGLVNPPLASTAIGVVTPERAGMASGVNTTFRQIGIATSIAALGSIFAASLQHNLKNALAFSPVLQSHTGQIATSIRQGHAHGAIGSVPVSLRGPLEEAIKSSFAKGINELVIVTGVVALVGGLLSLVLIRGKDFIARHPESAPRPTTSAAAPGAA